jgi:hypothetical protein
MSKDKTKRRLLGIGYLGEGLHKTKEMGKQTLKYTTWNHMITRCYDKKYHEIKPTYKDCTVAEEWHNFQNFATWWDENYYEIDGEKMHLDKDILMKGNKVYSPDTCILVPQTVNSLFLKRNSKRGDLPIGVSWHKRDKRYTSTYRDGKGSVHIGNFSSSEEAFNAYKFCKEKYIKEVAEKYKVEIPEKLYNALYLYEVEIDD